jgi:uncharacterized protein
MIKRLEENNLPKLIDYLKDEPEANLYPISNIEAFGMDETIHKVWSEIDENGQYKAVLYDSMDDITIHTHQPDTYEFTGFAGMIIDRVNLDRVPYVFAKKNVMDRLMPMVKVYRTVERKSRFMCRCDELAKDYKILHTDKIRRADASDVPAISRMLDKIEEFPAPMNIGRTEQEVKHGSLKIMYIQDKRKDKPEDEIMSVGQIVAESSYSGLIAGVATQKEYRGKGYASDIVFMLTKSLIDREKTACLTYDNPQAGSIYKRLGYKELFKYDKLIFG